jgi:probable rRNA maturation factor
VVLTDDDEISQLNRDYLGQDRTTDVLSFGLDQGPGAEHLQQLGMLGDVVISVEQAERQRGADDLDAEIARLMVHGLCHLRGFEHGRQADRRAMRREEQRLLSRVLRGRVSRTLTG